MELKDLINKVPADPAEASALAERIAGELEADAWDMLRNWTRPADVTAAWAQLADAKALRAQYALVTVG